MVWDKKVINYILIYSAHKQHSLKSKSSTASVLENGSTPPIQLSARSNNPWAGFKRCRLSSRDASSDKLMPAKKVKKLVKEPPAKAKADEHVCLKCGARIARGRDFYKKRHWMQVHKDEQQHLYLSMIVPENHEKARKVIREKKGPILCNQLNQVLRPRTEV